MTRVLAAASKAKPEPSTDPTLLLAIISAVLLVCGIAAVVLLIRTRAPKGNPATIETGHEDESTAVLQMLLASQEPALRKYLQHTPDPAHPTQADGTATIQRIARIVTPKQPKGRVAPSLSDVLLALALLESRLTALTTTATRIEAQSVTKDRVVWTVLGVIGAIVGILGGLAALTTLLVRLAG